MVSVTSNECLECEDNISLVGLRDFVVIRKSIRTLLGGGCTTTIFLGFAKLKNKLPRLALSSVSPKKLFWMLSEPDTKVSSLTAIKVHKWCAEDEKKWKDKSCSNDSAVFITFRYDKANPSKIEIMFTHNGLSSMVYSYQMCPIQQDAYFIIRLPEKKFEEKRAVLMGTSEFYTQMAEEHERITNHLPFESSQCIICCRASAEIVFVPCGHSMFCAECLLRFREERCPNCKAEREETVTRRMSINICMVCPERIKCAQMNALLLPCCCVVGCIKTTRLAIEIGDACPNPECKIRVERVQQIYS